MSTTADGQSVKLHAEGKDQSFTFDRVFGPQADQAAVFQEVSELVQSALDGYKVRMESLCWRCSALVTFWCLQLVSGPQADQAAVFQKVPELVKSAHDAY